MICIPIVSNTTEKALSDMKNTEHADLIELRLDLIGDISEDNLKKLIENQTKSIIVTDRKNRLNLIEKAIELKVDYIDIDISEEEQIKQIQQRLNNTRLIISYHDFKKTDKVELDDIYDKILSLKPNMIKIATMATSIVDNLTIFNLIKRSKKQKIIALCMGEKGEISRVLGPMLGSEITYGSLGSGKESAPGQIPAEKLRDIFRVNDLKRPMIYGLVGNPVSESKGYIIHNKSFQKLHLNSVYVNFLVDNLNRFITQYKEMVQGLSVTMPFKEKMLRLVDELDPTTEKIGAVNTVVKKGKKLVGYNTDYIGTIKAIESVTLIQNKKVYMIGAGGVAKAIAFGIKEKGGDLYIMDIDEKKAFDLADQTHSKIFDTIEEIENADILINATPVGMHPMVDNSPVDKKHLKPEMVVFDVVYNPLITKLLKDAEEKGCKIISGIELFINQAIAQFELWTEQEAPREIFEKGLK